MGSGIGGVESDGVVGVVPGVVIRIRRDRRGRVVGEGDAGRGRLDVLVDRVVFGLRADGVLGVVAQGAGGEGVAPRAGTGRRVEDLGGRVEAAAVPVLVVAQALDRDADAGEPGGVRVRVVGAAGEAAGPAARVVEGAAGREADRAGRWRRVVGEGEAGGGGLDVLGDRSVL